jgi:hypothetical protein
MHKIIRPLPKDAAAIFDSSQSIQFNNHNHHHNQTITWGLTPLSYIMMMQQLINGFILPFLLSPCGHARNTAVATAPYCSSPGS